MSANEPDRAVNDRIGAAAEELAARHLIARGLKLVVRNYRIRGGEIDLIADDRGCLVFVEVRLRTSSAFGGAGASITAAKQRRVILAAQHYLAARGGREPECRFDCILLDTLDADAVEWIKGAFTL